MQGPGRLLRVVLGGATRRLGARARAGQQKATERDGALPTAGGPVEWPNRKEGWVPGCNGIGYCNGIGSRKRERRARRGVGVLLGWLGRAGQGAGCKRREGGRPKKGEGTTGRILLGAWRRQARVLLDKRQGSGRASAMCGDGHVQVLPIRKGEWRVGGPPAGIAGAGGADLVKGRVETPRRIRRCNRLCSHSLITGGKTGPVREKEAAACGRPGVARR